MSCVSGSLRASHGQSPLLPIHEKGVFVDAGDAYRVAQDYAFNSPSTASGVLLGRTSNGRVEWKTNDGRTLKSVQEADAGS